MVKGIAQLDRLSFLSASFTLLLRLRIAWSVPTNQGCEPSINLKRNIERLVVLVSNGRARNIMMGAAFFQYGCDHGITDICFRTKQR
jgi:hypothetical protein